MEDNEVTPEEAVSEANGIPEDGEPEKPASVWEAEIDVEADPSEEGESTEEDAEDAAEIEDERPDWLPEGFETPEQALAAFKQQIQQLQPLAQYGQQALQQQQQPRQPVAPAPATRAPHAGNRQVEQAVKDYYEAQRGNEDASKRLKNLPQVVQQQALEHLNWIQHNDDLLSQDPGAYFNQFFAPLVEQMVEQRVAGYQQIVQKLYGDRFRAENKEILETQEDERRLAKLMGEMTQEKAVEFLRMEKKFKALQAREDKVNNRARTQKATKRARRSSPGRGKQSRESTPNLNITAPAGDIMGMYRQMKDQGAFDGL